MLERSPRASIAAINVDAVFYNGEHDTFAVYDKTSDAKTKAASTMHQSTFGLSPQSESAAASPTATTAAKPKNPKACHSKQ
jgi:hypothetical protein